MGQTEQRIDQRLARMDEARVATAFIKTTAGHISARQSDQLSAAGKPVVMFAGQPQSMAWMGLMPARDGAGGRYFFRLALEQVDSHAALVVRFTPYVPGVLLPDWAAAESRVLVGKVDSVAFAYENALDPSSGWLPEWLLPERLPDAVRLALVTPAGPWPPLTIPLRAMPWGDGAGSGVAVFGGSR
jgi:general secretion pathway protein J